MFALECQKQFCRARGFLVGHAGHGFVEQQQFGVLHQQHADLQPLLLAVAQVAGEAPDTLCQMNRHQYFSQPVALFGVELEEHGRLHALVGFQREFQVFKHGELFKHRWLLKFSTDTQLRNVGFFVAQQINRAAKENRAFVGSRLAGDDVHHRGLAGAVGTDDATQLAGRDIERQLVDGFEAIKADADVFKIQNAPVGRIDLTCRHGDTASAGVAPTRFGVAFVVGQSGHALFDAPCALFQQFGCHAAFPFHSFFTRPTTPLGRNKVTAMKSVPKKYSQNSG